MGNDRPTSTSGQLVGADRDAVTLAESARAGTSLLIAGPRGSGRSYLMRAITAELQRTGTRTAVVRPCSALTRVPYGALDATGDPCLDDVRELTGDAPVDGVIVVDDVDALDTASVHALERAVATRRTTVVFGMRTARPRAVDPGDDADEVRRAVLGLWMDGILRRIDLRELSDEDARGMIDLFPDASLLDNATRAALVWRADGSRALLRHLVLEATGAARAGRDPLSPLRAIARDSRLAVALERHVAEITRPDLECLAGVLVLPHLELAAATRLFNAESVHALLASGLLHADPSSERRLTVNDLVAQEARRQLGTAYVDDLVRAAGSRMLAEDDEWWSHPIAVAVSERWHRLGADSDENDHPPSTRVRVALAGARAANDRGDTAHAAAHALRGLRAKDDPALRLEAELAAHGSPEIDEDIDPGARRRIARAAAERRGASSAASSTTEADARVERLLADALRAGAQLDWARAAEAAARAAAETAASPAARLRATVAVGTAETYRGRWKLAQHHYREVQRTLDARRRADGIGPRERLAAVMSMLAGHQIAGADGAGVRERLNAEVATTAREGESAELTLAGAAGAIAYAGAGRPLESARELTSALSREPAAVAAMSTAMIELGVAEELALAGRLDEARAIIAQVDDRGAALVQRSRLYVQTTVRVAEGRHEAARETARAAAELTRGTTAAALRIRDLFRLVTLNAALQDEIDELVQLAATTDLPIAAEAVRRAAARPHDEDDTLVDELRLHALWSSDSDRAVSPAAPVTRLSLRDDSSDSGEELTAREREIALMANEGLTNREIATRLFLSIRTVESHVYQARMKVGAASRRELGRLVAAGATRRRETAGGARARDIDDPVGPGRAARTPRH
ncbi:helix-turn-helix transcriptional regulator [Microbacterium testaceum]|uniref:helix-turn-helix transcriptional regulator n=1 Tax=Microbacterium testaceum TaxID=2033 RepID=UPI0022E45690|nr:helix-turn-helix transcriptional regulator [Microbacterium testaceum]